MVDNVDRNTIAGIMFLSMHLDSISTADNVELSIANAPTAPIIQTSMLVAGRELTIDTNFGYVRFNTNVNVLSQTDNQAIIVVPYDVNSLQITTKDAEGNIVVTTREVA